MRAGCVCVCECVCVWGWGGGGGVRRTRRNITRKQKDVKDPDHSTKSSGGRLHLNTHTAYTYVALNEVTPQTSTRLNGVHKTCAETAVVSCRTSHATTEERYQYTTSVDINTRYKRIQSLIQNHMRHVRSESAGEQRTALYKSYEQ